MSRLEHHALHRSLEAAQTRLHSIPTRPERTDAVRPVPVCERFFGGAGGFVDDLDAGARHQALSYFAELSRSKISSSLAASDS
jgi:hypothetical protein